LCHVNATLHSLELYRLTKLSQMSDWILVLVRDAMQSGKERQLRLHLTKITTQTIGENKNIFLASNPGINQE
jgi:hypothetical protein